jgi:hypothetical protein
MNNNLIEKLEILLSSNELWHNIRAFRDLTATANVSEQPRLIFDLLTVASFLNV